MFLPKINECLWAAGTGRNFYCHCTSVSTFFSTNCASLPVVCLSYSHKHTQDSKIYIKKCLVKWQSHIPDEERYWNGPQSKTDEMVFGLHHHANQSQNQVAICLHYLNTIWLPPKIFSNLFSITDCHHLEHKSRV